jgi:hypothetical protein
MGRIMDNSRFLKESCKGVFNGLTGVFFATIGVEEFELVAGLPFRHSKPLFEDLEDGVGKLVGNCINPGIAGSEIHEGKGVFSVAV